MVFINFMLRISMWTVSSKVVIITLLTTLLMFNYLLHHTVTLQLVKPNCEDGNNKYNVVYCTKSYHDCQKSSSNHNSQH